MNRKKFIYGFLLFLPFVISAMPGKDTPQKGRNIQEKLNQVPDSVFKDVKMEDLLADEVYVKLARDGWSAEEIKAIMSDYVRKNKNRVKGSLEYGRYAKQWLPTYGYTPGEDTLYQFIDTTYNETMMRSVRKTMGKGLDDYYKSEPYTPDDRKHGKRNSGIFRPAFPKPSSGRIHWIHVHPENDDSIMVIPDGGGINRTHDGGKTWDCITDRIPLREHRNTAVHSAIPVDPDDWNHVFAFMSNGNPVYETCNGGETWKRIEGATHKTFKRGYCFRDKAGKLKFIGATQNSASSYWNCKLWISEDTCKTWTEVIIPEELKDIRPESDGKIKGEWFQEVAFDPSNRDMVYIPTSRSIFYFDDGAKSYEENGVKVYKIKKMNLRVFDQDSLVLRSDTIVFPFKATTQAFLNINPNNPDQMWFATGSRAVSYGNYTALYYTNNKGLTWITLQEPMSNIGSGSIFGNETPWGWLGGFGVNYIDPNWIYGCSMSSAISNNGGKKFSEYGWSNRLKSLQDDGLYYAVSNSRHNADNHCIVSHKSGRVFRGSDGGMLMKDLGINNNNWTNIGGNMGQMLFYCVKVNEFGDQVILGNTQDIDAQTYRYGRWGNWRGYEGSTAFINPYSNTCYFSGSGGGGINDINFSSWNNGWTKADICTGNWYLRREGSPSFYRLEDFGSNAVDLEANLGEKIKDFALARDKGHCTIFVITNSNKLKKSVDNGNTFELVKSLNTGTVLAADPEDSNILYFGQQAKVLKYTISEDTYEDLTYNLPKINCNDLILHEGSGDLYFVHTGSGIYLKEHGSNEWKLWMKGYNPAKLGSAELNYTTQEMVIHDYGRGIYIADLQNPSDRYFKNGFGLKEISNIDGRRTIGIDTQWTIPLYYHYEWTVNGVVVENPYQYFVSSLIPGDKVQLKLTLRESPDVSTTSAEYIVKKSAPETLRKLAGKALYSDGKGRVDLGYVDYFFNDFTVELWIKPQSNGVVLCNRQKEFDKGAKGWYLAIDSETLRFKYAPANLFDLPTYEKSFTQQTELNAGSITIGKWMHVAVTHQRNGNITIYVNGEKRTQAARILPEHTLNNAMYLSLFADGYEKAPIDAAVDELKIWNYALTDDEVRQVIFSHSSNKKNGLVYYNGFNNDTLTVNGETFTKQKPQIRMLANVVARKMPISLCAEYAICNSLLGRTLFAKDGINLMAVSAKDSLYTPKFTVYGYTHEALSESISNLDKNYYTIAPMGFQFKTFDSFTNASDTLNIEFYKDNINPDLEYRLLVSENDAENKYWQQYTELSYNAVNKTLEAKDICAYDLVGKLLIIVTPKPAIEVSVREITKYGKLNIYSPENKLFTMDAQLVGNLTEPFRAYQVKSDHTFLSPIGSFEFTKGKASAKLSVNIDSLGTFGDIKQTYLRGKDDKMIPFPINVANCIVPNIIGNSVHIQNGGFLIGNADTYSSANLSNTITMMGWVRIDTTTVLSGVRPLIFFRSLGNSTGIHLANGNLRCHWNEESWSWNAATNLNVTQKDLGKWIHLALVARPDGMDYYLNGAKHTIQRAINKTNIKSALMLGQNNSGDTWFSGAFDQVVMWNRSLSQDEIVKYMQKSVALNDSALIICQNMDYADPEGNILEPKTNSKTASIGTLTKRYRSPVPFNVASIQKTGTNPAEGENKVAELIFPDGKSTTYYINTFNGYPYNYIDDSHSTCIPLSKEFYTLIYAGKTTIGSTDSIIVNINHPAILANDSLALAIRPLGSEAAFDQYLYSMATENNKAIFKVEGTMLNTASEFIVMIAPESGKRPIKAELSVGHPVNGNHVVLKDEETLVPIQIKMLSNNPDDVVLLSVKETEYASLERDTIELKTTEDLINIRIDKDKLNKMGLNPLTVNLVGADAKALNLQISLEPKVMLHLKNGEDDNHLTATTPITTLEVEAKLVQGVMDEDVKLAITADINNSLNTGTGTLLTDRVVTFNQLEHFKSDLGQGEEGWNLIGNPFLTNINLTKKQNVQYDEDMVTKFIYQYNKAIDNYEVWDMTNFDADQKINPFQSYFVQTLADKAQLKITPIAKETTLSRRTLDHYNASERISIRLQLLTNGSLSDRTDIILEPDAHKEFIVNEDASKLWSMSASTNQLYSAAGQIAVSINTLPIESVEIPIEIKVGTTGEISFYLDRITGFDKSDHIMLHDNQTGFDWIVDTESDYSFQVTQVGNVKGRFVLSIKRIATSINENFTYPVKVEGHICTISNLQGNAQIGIFDIQGRQIIRETVYGDIYKAELQSNAYLVKIKENGKEYITKIIVR